jgi:uncharacterized protein (DUF2132 family)
MDCFADASSLAMTTQFLWHTPLIKQDRHCEQFYREAIQAVSKKSTLYVDCFADASSLAMTTQFLWHTPLIKQDRHCEQFYREAIQAVSKKSTLYGLLR